MHTSEDTIDKVAWDRPSVPAAVPVELVDMAGGVFGNPCGIAATAAGTIHRRMAAQPKALAVFERLARRLQKSKLK